MSQFETILLNSIFLTLIAALIIFVSQALRQRLGKQKVVRSFASIMSFLIIGWLGAELFENTAPEPLREAAAVAHFLVMAIFAVSISLQWRSATRKP